MAMIMINGKVEVPLTYKQVKRVRAVLLESGDNDLLAPFDDAITLAEYEAMFSGYEDRLRELQQG
jgi:hypothetical protein